MPNEMKPNLVGSSPPLFTGEQLRAKLRKYDRTPFIDLLALWMECTPSIEVIELFAQKYPDRFVKSLADLGRLAGYADKSQLDVNLTAQIGTLSDSQLEDRMRKAAERLGIEIPEMKVIDLEPVEVGSQGSPASQDSP